MARLPEQLTFDAPNRRSSDQNGFARPLSPPGRHWRISRVDPVNADGPKYLLTPRSCSSAPWQNRAPSYSLRTPYASPPFPEGRWSRLQ